MDEQQQQALEELDDIQDKILEAVKVASEAVDHLSRPEDLDEVVVQKSYEDYLIKMKEVHEGLASRACWIKNYVPYNRNTEDLRREVDVMEMRVEVLKEEAKRLGWKSGDDGGGGGTRGEEETKGGHGDSNGRMEEGTN